MKFFTFFYTLLIVLALAGCSDTAQTPPGTPPTTPPAVPPAPVKPPVTEGECTYEIRSDITVATTWVNTPAACDYEVGVISVTNGQLTIEPGTVVRFRQDGYLNVDVAGSLYAVGTPSERITFEGGEAVKGFGKGLYFSDGSLESRVEYADLRYLGKLDEGYYKFQNGAISGYLGGGLTLKNTTVMGSNYFGAELNGGSLVLSEFANNRFYDNADAGVFVSPENVSKLDAASDYVGEDAPNGLPYILVGRSYETAVYGTILWPNTGAPYGIQNLPTFRGDHVIAPGAEFVFDEDGFIRFNGGTLTAVGTPQQPIIFRGLEATPGWWADIEIVNASAQLQHVEVRHGGYDGLYADRSITAERNASLQIDNSVIADGLGYGVVCVEESQVSVGAGMRFENLTDEPYGVDGSCSSFVTP